MTSQANLEYSEKDEEVFEVYSRLRFVGLMIMDYEITPKIIDAIKTYDKQIFWSFYS